MKKATIFVYLLFIGGIAFSVDLSYGFRGAAGLIPGSKAGYAEDTGNTEDTSVGFASNVGLYMSLNIFPWLSFQPEVNAAFMILSHSESNEISGYKAKVTNSWQNLEIPILVKFGIPSGKFRFRLFVGPNFAFSLGKIKSVAEQENSFSSGGETSSHTTTLPVDNKLRIGWIGGVEMVVAFSEKFDFGVDLRYVGSPEKLGYITSGDKTRTLPGGQIHRILLSLSAGWRI